LIPDQSDKLRASRDILVLIGPDEDIQCFRHDIRGAARAVVLQAVERRNLEQPANERLFLSGKNLLLTGAA